VQFTNVPKTLDEAINLIVADLRPEDVEYIKREGASCAHHGFGTAMRNGWGLWEDNELTRHFRDSYGLGHADDMSGLILSGVEAKVKGIKFDLDGEIARYKKHWANYGVDPLTCQSTSNENLS
jgi:hypothetical protein